jgi:hypothetical protein
MLNKSLGILFITLLFTFFSSYSLVAQDQTKDVTSEQIRDMISTTSVPDKRVSTIVGSPFFNTDFVNGEITLANNLTTNVLPLRFNAYEGTLQFKDGNEIYAIEPSNIREFEMHASDGIITFKRGYSASRLDSDDFVAMLADGEAKFMVLYSKSYREDISGYGNASEVGEYVDSNEYYVKFGNSDLDRLRSLGERRVLRSFPSHRDQLEDYVEQNNLQLDEVTDVARLFKYYNSLLAETS